MPLFHIEHIMSIAFRSVPASADRLYTPNRPSLYTDDFWYLPEVTNVSGFDDTRVQLVLVSPHQPIMAVRLFVLEGDENFYTPVSSPFWADWFDNDCLLALIIKLFSEQKSSNYCRIGAAIDCCGAYIRWRLFAFPISPPPLISA